ncbi:MAG TPA: glycine zipper 2TM domain-containing protein [Hyphomicrobiales bacterium]|nr:glycine zipper 2TM domain-containing protein [Hyphomicrobiales bacterium]
MRFKFSIPCKPVLLTGLLGVQLLVAACDGQLGQMPQASAEAAGAAPPAAAANESARNAPAPAPVVAESCLDCGRVSAINSVVERGESSGVGAAIGALVGGVAGNQVGGGNGKRLATVAGVVGGALAGNTIERNRNSNQSWEIVINMDNGGERRISVYDTGGLSVGSRVSVQGDTIIPR